MSRSHLSRAFTAAEGLPLHTYQNQLRIERAKELLASGEMLSRVAAAVGFSDQAHFSRVFREFTAPPRISTNRATLLLGEHIRAIPRGIAALGSASKSIAVPAEETPCSPAAPPAASSRSCA